MAVRLCPHVCACAKGIIAMERTLLGVIRVDPRQILEDGIRKTLVSQAGAPRRTLSVPLTMARPFWQVVSALDRELRFDLRSGGSRDPKVRLTHLRGAGCALTCAQSDVERALSRVASTLGGFRLSFEYIQVGARVDIFS